MRLISTLIFSLFLMISCGQHSQDSQGILGIGDVTRVNNLESLSQLIVEENIADLEKYARGGGDLEIELASGRTLFTEACQWNKLKVIEFLRRENVALEKKDKFGKSPLDYAEEDVIIKRILFPELVVALKKDLFLAAKNNSLTEIKRILEENPPLNFTIGQEELGAEAAEFEGDTFLTFCVRQKFENILRLMAQPKYGLNPNLKNSRGESPLQISRQLNFTNIEKLLIRIGALE